VTEDTVEVGHLSSNDTDCPLVRESAYRDHSDRGHPPQDATDVTWTGLCSLYLCHGDALCFWRAFYIKALAPDHKPQ